jgi:hypothetical protein
MLGPTLQGHVDQRAGGFRWDVQDTLVSGLVDCILHRFCQGCCHDVGVGVACIAQQGAEQQSTGTDIPAGTAAEYKGKY